MPLGCPAAQLGTGVPISAFRTGRTNASETTGRGIPLKGFPTGISPISTQYPFNRKSRTGRGSANSKGGNGVMPSDLPSRLGMLTSGTIAVLHREPPSWIVTPHANHTRISR